MNVEKIREALFRLIPEGVCLTREVYVHEDATTSDADFGGCCEFYFVQTFRKPRSDSKEPQLFFDPDNGSFVAIYSEEFEGLGDDEFKAYLERRISPALTVLREKEAVRQARENSPTKAENYVDVICSS